MNRSLALFVEEADVSTWTGLPADAASGLGIDTRTAPALDGLLGDPPSSYAWTPLRSPRFRDGLRAWLDGDRVVLIEGAMPLSDDGGFLGIPDLGEPDTALAFEFGPLTIAAGERVYASRGLAVCVNPRSGVLLAVRGFAPTTPEDYRDRLRAVPKPRLRRAVEQTR